MNNFDDLTRIAKVVNSLEKKGLFAEVDKLSNILTRLAQNDLDSDMLNPSGQEEQQSSTSSESFEDIFEENPQMMYKELENLTTQTLKKPYDPAKLTLENLTEILSQAENLQKYLSTNKLSDNQKQELEMSIPLLRDIIQELSMDSSSNKPTE